MIDLSTLDDVPHPTAAIQAYRDRAAEGGRPDPALGFLARLGALSCALRGIERGWPLTMFVEDMTYAEWGRAPR